MRALPSAAATSAALAIALGGFAPAAFGQEEGVTLDPGDPAAKEYALPHEEARREAGDNASAPVKPGTRESALFGEGIDEPPSANEPASNDERPPKQQGKSTEQASGADDATATTAAPSAPAEPAEASVGGSGPSATAALLGGGAAVVLLGLLGGFGLRAVRGPRD